MLKDNKYSRWYFSIIQNCQNRTKTQFLEKHHIIPRSCGGSEDASNLVFLTIREHVICHLLLTKCTAGNHKYKMFFAYNLMVNRTKLKSRDVERAKILVSQAMKLQKRTPEWCKNISISKIGKTVKGHIKTKEWKEKLSQAHLGKFLSESHKKSISLSLINTVSKMSKLERQKYAKGNITRYEKGNFLSEESKNKISETLKNRTTYKIMSPNGDIIETKNIGEFCKANGIPINTINTSLKTNTPIPSGKAKGWQLLARIV